MGQFADLAPTKEKQTSPLSLTTTTEGQPFRTYQSGALAKSGDIRKPPELKKGGLFADIAPAKEKPIGFVESFGKDWEEKLPFAGPVIGMGKSVGLMSAARRLQEDDYPETWEHPALGAGIYAPAPWGTKMSGTERKQQDIKLVNDYFEKAAEVERRGYNWRGVAGSILSYLPGWAVEFAATGGVAKLTSEPAKQFATKAATKYAGKTTGKIAGKLARVGVSGVTRATILQHRVVDNAIKRGLPHGMKVDEKGNYDFVWSDENPFTSYAKAFGSTIIESATEEMGGEFITPLLNKLPLASKLTGALRRAWLKLNPNKSALDFVEKMSTKLGYNGIIEEIGEERLATILHSLAGTEDYGGKNRLDNLKKGLIGDLENLPAEIVAFSVPGVTKAAAAKLYTSKATTPVPIDEVKKIRKQKQVSDMEAKLYDILLKKTETGDAKAMERLVNLVQGLNRPTYEELLERAYQGDKLAVDAIQKGYYRGETPGGVAGTSMPLIQKSRPETKKLEKKIPKEQADEVAESLNLEPLPKKPVPLTGKTRERGFVTSVKEEFPELETRVAGEYVPRSTDKLAMKARNLIIDDIDAAENLARKANNDDAIATASELIKHYTEKAQTRKDNVYLDKAADIAHDAAAKLTELGRAVQAASILSRLTPEGQLRFAARTINKFNEKQKNIKKQIPKLTPAQSQIILKRSKDIQNMPDGPAKSEEFWKLQNYISELVPTSTYRKAINIWKAGLLTGIKTHGLNIGANLAHGVSEIVKDIPARAVDKVSSLFTKEQKIALTLRGLRGGVREGFQKGWKYLKTGYSERDILTKLDYRKVNWGKSKFGRTMQAYEQTVFRLLGAADQPFYYGAKAKSIASQAIAQAKTKKLKGKERSDFVNRLIENPTDEMIKYAVIDAETAVFQNRTALGDLARAIQKSGGEIIVPFGRTPSAVAMQIINYSPLGAVKSIAQQIKQGRFDQRIFSQEMGRALTGTAAIYLGTLLFKAGLIALDRPDSERERKLWELEGRQANSIKIGNKWRQIPVFGPIGNLLLVGGHFQKALDETGSPSQAIVSSLAGGGKSFSEQTFVTGINRAAEAISDPERSFETFFSSLVGSVVPTIVADVARATDITERRSKGPLQRILTRIPFARQKLEPRLNVFGQDLPRYSGNVLEAMIDPTRPAKIRQDVVVDELRRLSNNNIKVTPTLLGDKNGYEVLSPEQNTTLWRRSGEIIYPLLYNLMRLEGYKKLDDEQKGREINNLVQTAKDISRAAMVIAVTQGLTGKEEIAKLRELREGGLLTNSVLKIYVESK
jgi:hypothetical protein